MKLKTISAAEYAEIRNCSKSNVIKQMRHGRSLPGVANYEKIGSIYIIRLLPGAEIEPLIKNK